MMSRFFLSTAVAGLMLGIAGPAPAQEPEQSQQQDPQQQEWQQQAETEMGRVVMARDVIGMDLATVEGADLGEVEDIVYDIQGQYYLLVSQGGFLGIGKEYRLVPMERVSYGPDVLVIMSEADLSAGYDPNAFMSVEPDFEMNTGY